MRQTISLLLKKLAQQIHYFDQYAHYALPAYFSPYFFQHDPTTVKEAQLELIRTFNMLKLSEEIETQRYYAQRFSAQYMILFSFLKPKQDQKLSRTSPIYKNVRKAFYALPPQERLQKSFIFLRRLNERKHNIEVKLYEIKDENLRRAHEEKLLELEQRIKRCRDEIDNLETYLNFSQ